MPGLLASSGKKKDRLTLAARGVNFQVPVNIMLLMVNVIRLLLSLVPAFFGLILLGCGVFFEFAAEGVYSHLGSAALRTKQALDAGKVIYVAGQPEVKGDIVDPQTKVAVPGLVLDRCVKGLDRRGKLRQRNFGALRTERLAAVCTVNGLEVPADLLKRLPASQKLPRGIEWDPPVGEPLVTYYYEPIGPLSIIATKSGNTLAPYAVSQNQFVYEIKPGIVPLQTMVAPPAEGIALAIRIGFWVWNLVAICMLFRPLSTLGSFVVISSRTNEWLLFIVACVASAVIGCCVTALASLVP